MGYHVSVLDQTFLDPLDSADSKRRKTIRLAKQADYFGFHRFWVAPDLSLGHFAELNADSLAASVLDETFSIRVTSLSNLWLDSARSTVERYLRLAAISRSKTDLVVSLIHPLFRGSVEFHHLDAAAELAIQLETVQSDLSEKGANPEKFLVGVGPDAAKVAGAMGWTLVYPGHLNNDAATFRATLETYRAASGGKTPVVALSMFADESEGLAFQKTAGLKGFGVVPAAGSLFQNHLSLVGQRRNLKSSVPGQDVPRPIVIVGTGIQICAELDRLEDTYGVEEFLLVQPRVSNADLMASLELLSLAPLSAIA